MLDKMENQDKRLEKLTSSSNTAGLHGGLQSRSEDWSRLTRSSTSGNVQVCGLSNGKDWSFSKPENKTWKTLIQVSPKPETKTWKTLTKVSTSSYTCIPRMNMKSYNYMKVSELNLENRKLCEKMRETLMKPRDILQTGQTLKSGKKNVGIEIFPAKQESEMGKVAEKKLGKESADVVKEIEKADFPMYPVLKVNTTQTESWMEDDKADRIKAEELKIFTQKDCLLKIVSLIVGEKSKQLLKPGSKLRMLLEQHLAPLLLSDPEFILKVSLYCRRELNLRLVSNFLLAYAAANKNTAGFLKKYFKMAVRLPSDWLQVASIELGMDTNLKRGNVPMALRRVLMNKFTDFDEYQLAKYNKSPKIGEEEEDIKDREFSMKRLVRTLHIHEPADLVMKLLGKRYPEDRERFRECRLPGQFKPQLAGKRMKLETPETWETMISAYPGNKSEVWEHLIENRKLPYTATIRNIRNLLLTGVSDEYLKKAADFISNKIMVEKGGMFPFQYFSAYDVLLDLETRKGKAPPKLKEDLEPWQKAKIIGMKSKLKNVTDFKLKIMKRSLDTAVNISARINVPPLQGRSLVLCSYGLDGLVKMGAGRGIGNTGATLRDTALLYSVMVSARAEESNLVLFSKSCVKVSLEKTDLLKNIELVSKLEEVQTLSNFNASLDPVKRILHEYIRDDIYVDNIILFHNNIQVQTHSEFLHTLDIYRQELNPKLLFTSVNVSGGLPTLELPLEDLESADVMESADVKETADGDESADEDELKAVAKMFNTVDSAACLQNAPTYAKDQRNVFISGLSDAVLKFLVANGNGSLVNHVENIDKQYSLDCLPGNQFTPSPRATIVSYPAWRSIKIFVSSTFLDMQGERNLLHVYVLPILELRCRSIYVKVDLVDLRWGVRSAEMGSGQVENCIQQVLAADLFIGILGERYGWIPPQQEHRNLPFTQGNGSTIDKKEVSITEIEIEVGALQRVNSHRDRCFFYFRDPEFLKTVPETARYNFTTQSAEDRKKLADLKARIKSSGLEVNEGYRAKYGGRVRGEHIAGNLQEFGDRVVENLWNSISNLYPPSIISSIHSIQALQQNQLSACSELAGSFIGRKREMKSVQRCIDKALANEVYGSIVRVLSPAGSGCTALLQMLTHTYRVEGLDVISYILDEKDMEENQREFLEYILYSLDGKPNRVQDVAELNLTIQQKIKKSKGKLLIIINRMDILGCIDWIPEMLPPGLIILTSCSPENKKCLQQFSSLQDVKLGQMDLKDRKDYVRSRLGVLGKTLNEDSYENQIDDLVSRREGGSPAWLNAAINRLVKFSSYNTISQDIRGLGNSMKELYLQQLSTAVDSCGEEAVSTAVRIIYLSKYGIHLSDLQALMSFLLYGELSKLSSIENTLIQFKQFRAKSEYIFPTLDLCTLLNQLDGVIVYISGVYTHPAGMVRKLLWEKFIRSTDPRSIKVLLYSLAALYLEKWNEGNSDPLTLKSLAHYAGNLNETKLLVKLLCSSKYCEEMSSAGLISHFLDLLLGSEIKLKQLKLKFCTDPLVEAWARFVQGHQEALEEEPRLVNQLLINQPKNSVIFKAFISSNQSFNKNSKLLEWLNRSVEEREDRLVSRKQEKSPTVILLRDTILFLGYSDGIISVLDSQTFREGISFIGHTAEITGLALASKELLLSVSGDGKLSSWDLRKKIRLNNVEAHSGRITGLCALNLNILTSGWDSNINIWSKGLVRLSQIFLNYVPINCICLHPFKNSVVVGSWDKSIRIFDIDSKEQKAKLTGASSIQKIALSEDATKIAAGTLCGKVELWDGRKGVKISSLNTGSSITALEFSSQARLLIGDSTGKITGVNYNEGSRVTAPEYPFQLPMYSSFSEQYNTQNIQEQTSLKRNISALTVAAHETFILGFDNGDVMFYQQEESSECYKGFGWHFADEPIAEIGHRLDFALEISDWSILDDQELGAFFVRSRSSVSVHSLRSRVCLYLEGIESEIVGVLLTEIKFDPHILVILESEILVYPAVQFGLNATHTWKRIRPSQIFDTRMSSSISRVEVLSENNLLVVSRVGEVWSLQIDKTGLVPNGTDICVPSYDPEVVGLIYNKARAEAGLKDTAFLFCSHGTVIRIGIQPWLSNINEFTINTSGILQVHSDTVSENILVLHACGTVSLLSPKGIEIGLYSGRYSGAWIYTNKLYIGSDTLQCFDPTKPNITIEITGHKGKISSLLNTGGEELVFVSSSEDGSVKQWTPNTRSFDKVRSGGSILSLDIFQEGVAGVYLLILTQAQLLVQEVQGENLLQVYRHQLPQEFSYVSLKCVSVAKGTLLIVIAKTHILIFAISSTRLRRMLTHPCAEVNLHLTSVSVLYRENKILCVFSSISKDSRVCIDWKGDELLAFDNYQWDFSDELDGKLNNNEIKMNDLVVRCKENKIQLFQPITTGSACNQIGEFKGSGLNFTNLVAHRDLVYTGDTGGTLYILKPVN